MNIGEEKFADDYLLFEVLNIKRAGPGVELAADADPGDGWLDIVSAAVNERRKLTQSIEKCLSDSRRGPILTSRRVKKIRLAIGKCELRLDDKVVLRSEDFSRWTKNKRAKIEIAVEPKALEFILPNAPVAADGAAEENQAKTEKK